MRFVSLSVALLVLCMPSCRSTRPSSSIQFVPFTGESYPPIPLVEVVIYPTRLQLPGKYEELGIVKFEGSRQTVGEAIRRVAAEKGANAIVFEGDNAVLLRLREKPKEMHNDTVFSIPLRSHTSLL
jgi:hypothetical protein